MATQCERRVTQPHRQRLAARKTARDDAYRLSRDETDFRQAKHQLAIFGQVGATQFEHGGPLPGRKLIETQRCRLQLRK